MSAAQYPGERDPWRLAAMDRAHPRPREQVRLANIDITTFADICARIRRGVPPGAGLIIPPYLRYFRDCATDQAVFFQDRHDGNLMLGSPRFFAFWKPRMIALFGRDYDGMPQAITGLQPSLMRRAYLAIDDARAAALYQRYPRYRYLVAESGQRLGYGVLAANAGFTVYDLAQPVSVAAP